MIVPNYVPEPLEVPGNVAEQKYPLRLAFIRRVTLLHLGSLFVVAMLTALPWPQVGIWPAVATLAGSLIILDLLRIWRRGRMQEARLSGWLLPLPLASVAWTLTEIQRMGLPVATPLAGAVCATVYTMLCGRDFSFVGGTILSLIASTVGLAGLALHQGFSARRAAFALAANAVFLLYLEYDLASLLARRRLGEEIAAVVDLYRDVFNFFGYAVRCWRHWKKHRIWEIGARG